MSEMIQCIEVRQLVTNTFSHVHQFCLKSCNHYFVINKALMINVKAQLMERDAIFVQLLANYLKCNAIELLR